MLRSLVSVGLTALVNAAEQAALAAAALPGEESASPKSSLPPYELAETYVSKDFFSKWTFFTSADPTHGFVEYVNRTEAEAGRLALALDGGVYMGADTRSRTGPHGRRSVRIESVQSYNRGLVVLKVDHMPTGCGTWPAFWLYGDDAEHVWPTWGELDIIEGVHTMDRTLSTLHTTAGCDQSKLDSSLFSGTWGNGSTPGSLASNCDVHAPNQFPNQGCSQVGPVASMGAGFNAAGGGTFATDWDPENGYIRNWFWPLGKAPEELESLVPNPSSWGEPYSYFSLAPDTCKPSYFKNMRLVFDLTFCGDWGGAVFSTMCPSVNMSCEDFVAQYPENMTEAYWTIRALHVYQRAVPPVVTVPTTATRTTTRLASATTTATTTTVTPTGTSRSWTSTTTATQTATATATATATVTASSTIVPAVAFPPPRSHWGSELLAALLSLVTLLAAAACLRNQRLSFGGSSARSPPMPSALVTQEQLLPS